MVQIAIYYATGVLAGILLTLGFQAFRRAWKIRRLAQMLKTNTPAAIAQMMCPSCFGAGGTAFGTCPTCKGSGKNPGYIPPPLPDGVLTQMAAAPAASIPGPMAINQNPVPGIAGAGSQPRKENETT